MNQENKARLSVITSMFIFGTIGIVRRYLPIGSGLTALLRSVIGFVFLIVLMAATKKLPDMGAVRRRLPRLCLSGAMLGINWILLFEAYNHTTVATATLCYYMAPVFILIASPFTVCEKLTVRKSLCVLATLAGMALVSGIASPGGTGGELTGILLGLAAAVLYAAIVLVNKGLTDVGSYDRTAVQMLVSAVVLLPYVLFAEGVSGASPTALTVILVIVMGTVHTGLAYALYFGALTDLPAQTAAILSYIDPVVAVLLSALFLREPISAPEILGAVLILGAAIVSELKGKNNTDLPKAPQKYILIDEQKMN